ncbi:extracellular solute-binding protein [Romeria aff. gracilis LEGE 07310]|uniref:Extracellular solute-binding protein n=1 Tax=Vasconcelosia minhoensis LEGE 07310 TaxID=915328 RepID=A0A8J7DCU5_9CYAN|nr:extracellular solute-binding protein [Romeria gracilis]MBE9079252.1 extracellular solute-binding protein [Romeria aff. gracilis LEGE 07310]
MSKAIRRRTRTFQFLWLLLVLQLIALIFWWSTWPVTLSLRIPSVEAAYWSELIEDFEAQNPGIHIAYRVDNDYTTDNLRAIYADSFESAAQSETARSRYDLVYIDIVWLEQFAAAGGLRDLSQDISRSDSVDLAAFLPSEVEAGKHRGNFYRLPMHTDLGLLFYRQDLLSLPPAESISFEQLQTAIAAAQQAQSLSAGYLWQGRQYEGLAVMFSEVLAGFGGFWLDAETGEVGLDQPAAIQAATWLQALIRQGISPRDVTSDDEEATLSRFLAGKVAAMRGWHYFQKRIQASQPAVAAQLRVRPVPSQGGIGEGCQGGWGLGIASNTAHPKAAWRALEYLTSAAAQKKLALASGYLPSRTALFNDADLVQAYPELPQILDWLQTRSVLRPQSPHYSALSEVLQDHLSRILVGARSQTFIQTEMQEAAAQTRALLKAG